MENNRLHILIFCFSYCFGIVLTKAFCDAHISGIVTLIREEKISLYFEISKQILKFLIIIRRFDFFNVFHDKNSKQVS